MEGTFFGVLQSRVPLGRLPLMARRTQPRLNGKDKAVITKAASELAEEMNGDQLEEIKRLKTELATERRRRNATAKAVRNRAKEKEAKQKGRRLSRRGTGEKVVCKGLNLMGKPCKNSALIPGRWEGPEKITGLYCLSHEPTIPQDRKLSFQLTGSPDNKTYRTVTPGEMAHLIIQRSPHHFFRPYLKSLGLDMDEDGNLVQKGMGLRLHGFSRSGEVVRSPYPDWVGQVNISEKLFDRVYGKARQAVDLASMNTTVAVNIEMSIDRVTTVASVLAQAGALPNGNGDVIEGEATDISDTQESLEE